MLPSIAAYCFWQWVSFAHLPLTLSQMTSALSIFIAAVLVRLARGMPTLDWKTVPIEKRKVLTGQLVDVSREYAGLLALLMLLLIMAVSIGTTSVWLASLDEKWGRLVSAATGFLVVLSILRFGLCGLARFGHCFTSKSCHRRNGRPRACRKERRDSQWKASANAASQFVRWAWTSDRNS